MKTLPSMHTYMHLCFIFFFVCMYMRKHNTISKPLFCFALDNLPPAHQPADFRWKFVFLRILKFRPRCSGGVEIGVLYIYTCLTWLIDLAGWPANTRLIITVLTPSHARKFFLYYYYTFSTTASVLFSTCG